MELGTIDFHLYVSQVKSVKDTKKIFHIHLDRRYFFMLIIGDFFLCIELMDSKKMSFHLRKLYSLPTSKQRVIITRRQNYYYFVYLRPLISSFSSICVFSVITSIITILKQVRCEAFGLCIFSRSNDRITFFVTLLCEKVLTLWQVSPKTLHVTSLPSFFFSVGKFWSF